MTWLDAIILGLVQGLTEFLPVSSSAHLVIIGALLKCRQDMVFDIAVHLGTLGAILIYYRVDLWRLFIALRYLPALARREAIPVAQKDYAYLHLYLFLATLPAVVVGLTLKDRIEQAFASPLFSSAMLLITGVILYSSRWSPATKTALDFRKAIWIGLAQACAILPGISRSGSTITAGLLLGLERPKAAEFSFLMAIPAIGGAAVLFARDVLESGWPGGDWRLLVVGAIVSFVTGYVAIAMLLKLLRRDSFGYFAYYCWAAGLFGIGWFLKIA